MTSDSSQCSGCKSKKIAPPLRIHVSNRISLKEAIFVSVFSVPKMDCPSEENLIKTAFSSFGESVAFKFDIPNRKVHVYHADSPEKVQEAIKSVGLGATCISLENVDAKSVKKVREEASSNDSREAWVLSGSSELMRYVLLSLPLALLRNLLALSPTPWICLLMQLFTWWHYMQWGKPQKQNLKQHMCLAGCN